MNLYIVGIPIYIVGLPIVELGELDPDRQFSELDRLETRHGRPLPAIVNLWTPMNEVTGARNERPA